MDFHAVQEFMKDKQSNVPHAREIDALLNEAIECVILHPVRLEIIRNDEKTEIDTERVLEILSDSMIGITENEWRDVEDWVIKHDDLDSVIIRGITRVYAINPRGSNVDPRSGGSHMFNPEDYYWDQMIDNQLTLYDLASIAYRLKGSKYDWWYELYSSCKFYLDKSVLYMVLSFDHGS